ncbi:MAG TPA: hypothetical protein VFN05_13040 [Actinomycetes bacterium]|nr:hypothetical protein [Actinomycetes bacterium]
MELHLFGATEDRNVWHTLAKLGANHEFTSEPWADANAAQAIGRPGKGKVLDSAAVMDGQGNLHVLVVTDEGGPNMPNKLWHAIRSQNRYWRKFADVEGGGAGAIGPDNEDIVAVSATTRPTPSTPTTPPDLKLHILALTNRGNLFHAVWAPATGGKTIWEEGETGQPAKWVKKFTLANVPVNPRYGTPGTFKTFEVTYLR